MKTTVKTRKDTVLGFLLKPEVNTISFTSSNTAQVADYDYFDNPGHKWVIFQH